LGLTYRFADPEVEARFWNAMMPQGRRRLGILCWAVVIMCLLRPVAELAGVLHDPGLDLTLATRGGQVAICLATLLLLRRLSSPGMLELLGGCFGLSYIATRCLLLAHSSPEGCGAMIVGSAALLLFGLPVRLARLAPAMLVGSALMLAVWSRGPLPPSWMARVQVGEWLIVVNLLGMTAVRMMGLTLRRQFALGQALRHLATHDGLTGIANRRHHDQFLTREWQRCQEEGRPISLVLLDVDFFKLLNDRVGHEAGDDCLRGLARLLVRCVAAPASLVARTGGEEFSCVLPDTTPEEALKVAEGIIACLASVGMPHPHSPLGPHITVSLGVATAYPAPGVALRDLTALADRLVYEAKADGRACLRQQVLSLATVHPPRVGAGRL
jgi:diguanylate cyclase (GGDEF)-like protein